MARRHGLIAVALAATLAAPAHAAGSFYPLYGDGAEPLRPGVAAAKARIDAMPLDVAVRADGVVAFATQGSVYWVRAGRLLRVPVPAYNGVDLAFAPDGDLLVASCPQDRGRYAAGVFHAAPGRAARLIAGRLGTARAGGDGGPATAATFDCASAIAVEPDGGLLVADSVAGQIRRVGTDGVIRTVAGSPGPERPPGSEGRPAAGDGGPALQATLRAPVDVAALAGGGVAILDAGSEGPDRIRIVDAAGTIRTAMSVPAAALAGAGGALLVATEAGPIRRLAPDGTVATLADAGLDRAGITPYVPVRGDPFASNDVSVSDVAAAPDGGVLVAADFAIRYLPPEQPSLLAVAIMPATRVPASSLTVSVRTTKPAQVRIGVWRGARRGALVTAQVGAGESAVPIPGPLAAGAYWAHVQAADHEGLADTGATVLVGGLPVAYARDFIRSRLDLFETFSDAEHVEIACRRMARGRVDCAMRARARCVGIASLRQEPDGTLSVWQYDGGRRCRFSQRRGDPAKRRAPGT
jgi:hypothetical protein